MALLGAMTMAWRRASPSRPRSPFFRVAESNAASTLVANGTPVHSLTIIAPAVERASDRTNGRSLGEGVRGNGMALVDIAARLRSAAASGSRNRDARSRVNTAGSAGAELTEINAAVVRREEIEEALVVARIDAEQVQHRAIVAAGRGQPAADQLPDVVPGDVARQKQRVDVIPELMGPGD